MLRRIRALLRPVWPLALLAGALGLLGGTTTVTLLAGITGTLATPGALGTVSLLWLGALACAAPAMTFLSEICNAVTGQRVVARLRRELCDRIASVPLDRVEGLTQPRLMAVLTGDLDTLSATALAVAPLIAATATVIGGLGYLGWLAPDLFAFVAVALALGCATTAWLRRVAIRRLEVARTLHDEMLHGFRAVVEGGKEIRLSETRRQRELGARLTGAIDRISGLHIRMRTLFGLADAISAALLFGVALAVLALGRDVATASTFVIALLYLRGPLDQVIGAIPMFARAQVSLRRVAGLEADLGAAEGVCRARPLAGFRQIALSGITYRYPGADAATISNLDLTLRPGEIVFVVGANGAGKSTFAKVLTGLYRPEAGAISVDGHQVDPADAGYRGLFSTVFHDFHAFGELVVPQGAHAAEIDSLIARLGLSGKVRVDADGKLRHSTLSAGQRRRVALLQVYLDRKPIVVLDEWAAEQDPVFRRFFYDALLPELRDRGAAILLISHDDRFFGCADRVVEIAAPTGAGTTSQSPATASAQGLRAA
jgi:putative ATP-binding cassette transporter